MNERRVAESRAAIEIAEDRAGRIERVGVEFIPEEARDSSPRNVSLVFIGANLCFPSIIFGWLPIVFGLSFWSAVSSAAVGLVVGTLVVLPINRIGPRTGTNATVSSGADFGIRGRFIGSGLTFAFALIFAAAAVWTSGDALTGAAHRLFGTSDGAGMRAIGYAIIAAILITIALLGHGTIVAAQKFVIPIAGLMIVLGFIAYAGEFTNSGVLDGEYALGGYWQTWVLSAVLNASGPVAYATNINDYTRRISLQRHSDRSIALWVSFGLIVGELVAAVFGAFTAVTFVEPGDSYTFDLITGAPGWFVLPILIIALGGALSQGILCLYSCALDLEALVPRLSRVHTTLAAAVAALALLYLGAFVFNAVDSITAVSLVLNALTGPWIGVLIVGAVARRSIGYDPIALQAYATGERGGRYWYTGGWNGAACLAWGLGSLFELLTVDASALYAGAWAGIANGVDVSLAGSVLIAAGVYYALIRLKPAVLR